MVGAEQIKVNFEDFNGVLEANFEGKRLEKLKTLTDCLKERIMFAPASSKDWFNNAFPGGYLDHVLRVNKKFFGSLGSKPFLILSSLAHDVSFSRTFLAPSK